MELLGRSVRAETAAKVWCVVCGVQLQLATDTHFTRCYRNFGPLANLPYVLDGETVVSQSNACLVYLAGRFGALHPPSPLTVLIYLRLKPK